MEKSGGVRMSREREVSTRMEDQKFPPETDYDESLEARSDDLRCQVGLCILTVRMH